MKKEGGKRGKKEGKERFKYNHNHGYNNLNNGYLYTKIINRANLK